MLKIIKMNYNKAHKRNCSALFGLVSELVLLVSNILILKSVSMTHSQICIMKYCIPTINYCHFGLENLCLDQTLKILSKKQATD